jgi:hypothetical protein
MSAKSSEEEVVGVGGAGSALAVAATAVETPMSTPATAANSQRIAAPFILPAAQLDSPAKLAPDIDRRMPNATNVVHL